MGINNLNKLLRSKCPEVYREIHISEYAYKRIAIDISLFLCKFKAIYNEKWLSAFVNLVCCLRRNEIHCVFIYDTGSPAEKEQEKADRVKQREKNIQKAKDLEHHLQVYFDTEEIHPMLLEYSSKQVSSGPRLLKPSAPIKRVELDIDAIQTKLLKMKSNILNISEADFELTKELFSILDIPFFLAPLEAETSCADLCIRGKVDAVLTEDTDVLAYGCPIFLSKINTTTDTCVEIRYENILESLSLTSEQFLDLCIMCGCDYNKNIPKIGPVNALKLLQLHKSIEGIEKAKGIDVSILNHIRTRELFRGYKKLEVEVPYCGIPEVEIVTQFIEDKKIKIDIDKLVANCVNNNNMVIMDDDA